MKNPSPGQQAHLVSRLHEPVAPAGTTDSVAATGTSGTQPGGGETLAPHGGRSAETQTYASVERT